MSGCDCRDCYSSDVVSDSYVVCYRSKERADCRDTADGSSKATEELLVTSCDGVIGSIGATCLSVMAQAVLVDPEYVQTAQNMYSADFVVQIIVFGFAIPIAEEFMFRGVLYQRYRETRGFYYAAIWSALFFSVTHTNTVQMIYTFLLGILLCYVYEKFGSMKAPIMLHIVLNLGSLIFTDIGVFNWLAREPFKMAAAVIISTFICVACFVWIQRSGDPVSTQKTEE